MSTRMRDVTRYAIVIGLSWTAIPSRLPAQAADTVRLMPVNVLVTMPAVPPRTNGWVRRDSTLPDGRAATFLVPAWVYGRISPQLQFFWLDEANCTVWRQRLDSIAVAGPSEGTERVAPPEDYLSGRVPLSVQAMSRLDWARGDGWSTVYKLPGNWLVSCFDGARRPLAVAHLDIFGGTSGRSDNPDSRRFNGYTRDVLVAVGRAARAQHPRP